MTRVYFAYHHALDAERTGRVRTAWECAGSGREAAGFFDRRAVSQAKRFGDNGLRDFLREALVGTSVTCVIAGEVTATRRWVRYEIARSLIKGDGLLGIAVEGMADGKGAPGQAGPDPFDHIGLYAINGNVYFAERQGGRWTGLHDYNLPVPKDALWFPLPTSAEVVPLSRHVPTYHFVDQGGVVHIGKWIEDAKHARSVQLAPSRSR